jgi:xanthine dioxygenase
LLAVKVPSGRTQTLLNDDGSNDIPIVPLGTTAFVSGYTVFDLLTPAQQEFVRTAKVEYATCPYIWMSSAETRPTGLGMVSEGKELPLSELPTIERPEAI